MMNNYDYFEKQCGLTHNRRLIDGKLTGCGNCVGYCQYSGHRGFLTKEQRKEHNCIGKGCDYYVGKPKRGKEEKPADRSAEVVKIAAREISALEGMRVMRAFQNRSGEWVISYLTITSEYSITILEENISRALGEPVKMNKLDYDFDLTAQLVFAG